MSGDIISLIDDACEDWAVSYDAMRWQPPRQGWDRYEPIVRPPRGPVEVLMAQGWDGYAATAEAANAGALAKTILADSLAKVCAQFERAMREFSASIASAMRSLSFLFEPPSRLPVHPHVPNGREYTRRQRARRRRR